MKRILFLVATTTLAFAARNHEDYKLEEKSPIRHTFSNDTKLDVDNVNGYIQVVGDGGAAIRVEGEKIIRARDQQAMDLAKKEVVLDVNEKNGTAQLYPNGPFRGNNGDSNFHEHGFHEHYDRAYEVTYNFIVHVPTNMDLRLHSVNGALSAKNVRGEFDLHTINGAVDMDQISGKGKAYALNGGTKIVFRDQPTGDCNLQSFNGKLDVTLPSNLNANLKYKTFNGAVYTDFDGSPLPIAVETEKKDGKFVIRGRNSYQAMKIGNGGPELSLETFNGSIQVKKGK